jgi:uncharacterized protein YukE
MRAYWVAPIILTAIFAAGAPLAAQTHGGHGGGQMPGMQMPDMTKMTDQMMRNADTRIAKAESAIRDLSARQAENPDALRDRLVASMQGTLDQLRNVHGSLGELLKDPSFAQHGDSMKTFDQVYKNFNQIADGLQAMTRSMIPLIKGHDTNK